MPAASPPAPAAAAAQPPAPAPRRGALPGGASAGGALVSVATGVICGLATAISGGYLGFRLYRARLAAEESSSASVAAAAAARPASAPAPASAASPAGAAAVRRRGAHAWRALLPGAGAATTPVGIALRAFGYGSLLSLGTFGVAAWALASYVRRAAPRPPDEDYIMSARDLAGVAAAEDRAAVIDFGLWLDPTEVSDALKAERSAIAAAAAGSGGAGGGAGASAVAGGEGGGAAAAARALAARRAAIAAGGEGALR